MKVAQVAPLMESVPPRLYGGTERVVSYLTEELAALGHDVTLFASGDSVTRAALDPVRAQAIRLDSACLDPVAWHVLMLEHVARRAADFDVIHFHTDWLHLPLFSRLPVPFLTTLHGRLDRPEDCVMLRVFGRTPLVSISDAQRKPAPAANWLATVHHGLPSALFAAKPAPEHGYLAFLGRMSPEKARGRRDPHRARIRPEHPDRGEDRPSRRSVFPEHGAPPARRSERRVRRRDRRVAKGGVPRQRGRAPVPNRVARAVRHGHDRGGCIRNAGDRLRMRFGPRGHRARCHRLHCARRGRRDRCSGPTPHTVAYRRQASVRTPLHKPLHGGEISRPIRRG